MTDEEIRATLDESGDCENCDGDGTEGEGRYEHRCNRCNGTGFGQRAMLRAVQAVGQLLLNATERGSMSQENKVSANPASPADVARALVERSTPRLYCPTCEHHDPSPLVRDRDGTLRHSPCPAVSAWRGKDTPAEYPVRDSRSYPEREEYVEALRALLAAKGGER